jgi:hypothetical protein
LLILFKQMKKLQILYLLLFLCFVISFNLLFTPCIEGHGPNLKQLLQKAESNVSKLANDAENEGGNLLSQAANEGGHLLAEGEREGEFLMKRVFKPPRPKPKNGDIHGNFVWFEPSNYGDFAGLQNAGDIIATSGGKTLAKLGNAGYSYVDDHCTKPVGTAQKNSYTSETPWSQVVSDANASS